MKEQHKYFLFFCLINNFRWPRVGSETIKGFPGKGSIHGLSHTDLTEQLNTSESYVL